MLVNTKTQSLMQGLLLNDNEICEEVIEKETNPKQKEFYIELSKDIPVEFKRGIFIVKDINFEYYIDSEYLLDIYPLDTKEIREKIEAGIDELWNNGVADSPEQFYDKFYEQLDKLDKNIIVLMEIMEKPKNKDEWWRWEKQGIYYGNRKLRNKYMKHEAVIFGIMEVKPI